MPRNNRLTASEIERAVQMVADGASLGEAARQIGTTRHNMRYHCRKAGVSTQHIPPERLITIGERTQRLRYWAQEYGIPENTLIMRWRAGDRGDRLLRPVAKRHRPRFYDLGVPVSVWREVPGLVEYLGDTRRAAKKLGVPQGAIGCALRGEMERLG